MGGVLAIGVAVLGVRWWWRSKRRRKASVVGWDDVGEDSEVQLELLGERRAEGWSHG